MVSGPGKRLFLMAVCIAGELVGLMAAVGADNSLLSLVRCAGLSPVSTVWAVLFSFLPFMIAAVAVHFQVFPILALLGVLHSFLHGLLAGVLIRAYGTAGWLVQPLFQFSGNILLALFWGYLLRLTGDGRIVRKLVTALCAVIGVVILDYFVVSPFLAGLLDHETGEVRFSCWILCRLMKIT